MTIVTYSGPYVGPVFAAGVINAAWDLANIKDANFQTAIANANSYINTINPPSMTPASVSSPTVAEPSILIPSTIDTSSILAEYGTEYQALIQLLEGKFTAFRATHFPNESTVYSTAESWIKDAINNPNVALPPAVAIAIYGDDAARILSDASRATDEAMESFAARRFPLPPGAAASMVLQIQQKAQEELAKSSRAVAMKALEMMQFAIQSAMKLRDDAMRDCLEYIKALATAPDISSRVIGVGYDAQTKLISSVSSLLAARAEVAKLSYTADQHNADLSQDAAKENLHSKQQTIEQRVKTLLSEAELMAREAAALLNNLHVSSGTSFSESA